MKKAYMVRVDEDEGYDVIVFTETASKARTLAMQTDQWDGWMRFKDLRPRRFPKADHFVQEDPNLWRLNFSNPEHARFVRSEGWCNENGFCEKCGLSVFNNVPESNLDKDGVCDECRKEGENA